MEWSFVKNHIIDLINSFSIKEVSLGYRTVTLFLSEDLEEAQLGYSVDIDGQSLAGTDEGDWLSSWLVIGYEDETGDPIFIDTNDERLPVYTAMHGEGEWAPNKIAESINSFISALSYIREISIGRDNPVALENNPISSKKLNQITKLISDENKHIEMDFWESWLEDL